MPPCEDCATARPRYSPACLECGGRYLRAIQALSIPSEKQQEWLTKALNDWRRHGHSEKALRDLAK